MTKLLMRWTVMYESMGALEEAFSALELARVIILEFMQAFAQVGVAASSRATSGGAPSYTSQNSGLPCTTSSPHATPSIVCALVMCTHVVRLSVTRSG